MAANTPMLLKASMVDGRPDLGGVMSSGQVVGMIDDLPRSTVVQLSWRRPSRPVRLCPLIGGRRRGGVGGAPAQCRGAAARRWR